MFLFLFHFFHAICIPNTVYVCEFVILCLDVYVCVCVCVWICEFYWFSFFLFLSVCSCVRMCNLFVVVVVVSSQNDKRLERNIAMRPKCMGVDEDVYVYVKRHWWPNIYYFILFYFINEFEPSVCIFIFIFSTLQ